MRSIRHKIAQELGFVVVMCMFLLPSFALAEVDITDKVEVIKGRMVTDRATGDALIDVSIRNLDVTSLACPIKVLVSNISDPSVSVANADGHTKEGQPYFLYLLDDEVFRGGQLSEPIRWRFSNPERVRFNYEIAVFNGFDNHLLDTDYKHIIVDDENDDLFGVEVVFPENSFLKPVNVQISLANEKISVPFEGYQSISKTIKINAPVILNKPVEVVMPLEEPISKKDLVLILHNDPISNYWRLIPTVYIDYLNNRVKFNTNIFSELEVIKLSGYPLHVQLYMDIYTKEWYPHILELIDNSKMVLDKTYTREEKIIKYVENITKTIENTISVYDVATLKKDSLPELSAKLSGQMSNVVSTIYADEDTLEPLYDMTVCAFDGVLSAAITDQRYVQSVSSSCAPFIVENSLEGIYRFAETYILFSNVKELNEYNLLNDYLLLYFSTSGNLEKMSEYLDSENLTEKEVLKKIAKIYYKRGLFSWDDYNVDYVKSMADSIINGVYSSKNYYDSDFDNIVFWKDNCPKYTNSDQKDTDLDGIGDECDNCIYMSNAEQINSDSDQFGDACDNCPSYGNVEQKDLDSDNIGNECDEDADGDGFLKPNPFSDIFDCNDLLFDLTNTCIDYTVQEKLSEGYNALSNLADFSENAAESYLVAFDHFQQAGEVVGLDLSATQNEIDQALFFSSLARLAKIADPYSDLTDNGLINFGDILDAFGIGGTNADRDYLNQIQFEDCITVVDWTDPNTGYQYTHEECSLKEISSDSPTSGELQQFLNDKVVTELQIAIENLGEVSPAFNKEWIDPSDSSVTEFDYADVLVAKGLMQAMLAQIKLLNAYDFDVNLVDEQQAANAGKEHSVSELLALYPYLGALEDQASLSEAQTYIELSTSTLIAAIDAMDQENTDGENQADDFISFYSCEFSPDWTCGYDSAESSAMKDKLLDVSRSMVLPVDTELESPVDGNVYPVTVRFFNIFSGFDIRNQLPLITDNTTGFFPDPTLNGVIDPTQFDINEDKDADGHPDVVNDYTNFFESLVSQKQVSSWFGGLDSETSQLFKFYNDYTVEYQWHSANYTTYQQDYGQRNGHWEIDLDTKELVIFFSEPVETWIPDGQIDSIRVDMISGESLGFEVSEQHFLGSNDLITFKTYWWFSEIQSDGLFPQLLAAPDLTSPSNGELVGEFVPLRWTDVAGNYGYILQIDSLPEMDITDNQYDVDMQNAGTYSWRVCTKNSSGICGSWSSTRYFTVETAAVELLSPPALTSPSNGELVGEFVPLRWTDVAGNYGYILQIDSLPEMDITDNQYDVDMQNAGTYSWRVCTKNSSGDCGLWSSTWSFTVQ